MLTAANDRCYLLEPKAEGDMEDRAVLAKRDAALEWCRHATQYSQQHGGKPWEYLLIPHRAIAENMTLGGPSARYRS